MCLSFQGWKLHFYLVLTIWASDIQVVLAWIRFHSSNTTPPPSCEMCQVFKAFRMWKSTDMFVEYILSKTISCHFILLKMIILLVILANSLQFHNGKCWFKPCVSPSFFGPSTFSSLLWAVEYSIYPVSQKQGKEIHCWFFQLPQNSLQINISQSSRYQSWDTRLWCWIAWVVTNFAKIKSSFFFSYWSLKVFAGQLWFF